MVVALVLEQVGGGHRAVGQQRVGAVDHPVAEPVRAGGAHGDRPELLGQHDDDPHAGMLDEAGHQPRMEPR